MSNRYPYLPEGGNIKYVPVSDPFMMVAMEMRNTFSTDANHPTGAVVVMSGEIIGKDANQSALKNKRLIEIHKNGFCIRKFLKIKSGEKYWLCMGCASYKHHAEARAIADANKKGNNTKGADLYLYGHWWCCKPCWDAMIKAGIRDVYLVDDADALFKK